MTWMQHWNDTGHGLGHITAVQCDDECQLFDHFKVFNSVPPLSWEDGFNAEDWKCDECKRNLRYAFFGASE